MLFQQLLAAEKHAAGKSFVLHFHAEYDILYSEFI
jgi:hypothetical protein